MTRGVQRLVVLCVVAAPLAVVAGCGSRHAETRAGGAVLRVTERDFDIAAPAEATAGDVRLVVRNPGPDDHELIVVRTPVGERLPMRPDGITVDEDAVTRATVTVIEPRTAGAVTVRRLHLAPGRYTLLCNMSGHFLGGMHTTMVVR